MKNEVTVVIPTLNEERFLPRCLASLERQTLPPREVIVVDGGSRDGTLEIARDFGARVIQIKEKGIARARHIGFESARTPFIASTDADAVVPKNWLEELVLPFKDRSVVGTFGPLRFKEDGLDFVGEALTLVQRLSLLLRIPVFYGPNFAVRKEAFLRVDGFLEPGGDFPKGYPEADDLLIGLKLGRVGRVVFLPRLRVLASPRKLDFKGVIRNLCLYPVRDARILYWHLTGKLVKGTGHGRG